MARLEIEHIVPLARGGNDDEANLWLAYPLCNAHKMADFQPWHEQVLTYARADDPYHVAITGFDERVLLQAFLTAGFEQVKLQYEETCRTAQRRPAQAVLGTEMVAYLARLGPCPVDQPQATVQAEAFLAGRSPADHWTAGA